MCVRGFVAEIMHISRRSGFVAEIQSIPLVVPTSAATSRRHRCRLPGKVPLRLPRFVCWLRRAHLRQLRQLEALGCGRRVSSSWGCKCR